MSPMQIRNVAAPPALQPLPPPCAASIRPCDTYQVQPAVAATRATTQAPDVLRPGQARMEAGKSRMQDIDFQARSAVWFEARGGYRVIVISDEDDLAGRLLRNEPPGKATRLFLDAESTLWGRMTGTLRGQTGFLQWVQPCGDAGFRSQVTVRGKVVAKPTPEGSTTLEGSFEGITTPAVRIGEPFRDVPFAGKFNAAFLDLSRDRQLARNLEGLAGGWHRKPQMTFTKSLTNSVVSVARADESVRQAVPTIQVGPSGNDVHGPDASIGVRQGLRVLNGLGWQALQRVADYYGLSAADFTLPSQADLEHLGTRRLGRLLEKKQHELEQLIAQRQFPNSSGISCHIHFEDKKTSDLTYRELYVSFDDTQKKKNWIIPGLFRLTRTYGPSRVLYVPIIAEHSEDGGPVHNCLAGEAPTFAARGNRFFRREKPGLFQPIEQ